MRHVQAASAKTQIQVQTYSGLNRHAQAELRKMWLHATAADTHAIGWLPVAAFDGRADKNEILSVENNGDCVGWCMSAVSDRRGILKLYQIWVRPDARILEHGRALISRLQEQGRRAHCWQIEAWVAEDLPANLFWSAIGFARNNWRWGRGAKPRKHWRWTTPTIKLCTELPLSGKECDTQSFQVTSN